MDHKIDLEFIGELDCNKLNQILLRHICSINIHLKQLAKKATENNVIWLL
jgi:hypothetical protein